MRLISQARSSRRLTPPQATGPAVRGEADEEGAARRREVLGRGRRRARHVDAPVERRELVEHRGEQVGAGRLVGARAAEGQGEGHRGHGASGGGRRRDRYRRPPPCPGTGRTSSCSPTATPSPRRADAEPRAAARVLPPPAREPVQDAGRAAGRGPGDALRDARRRDLGAPGGGADHGRRRRDDDREGRRRSSSRRPRAARSRAARRSPRGSSSCWPTSRAARANGRIDLRHEPTVIMVAGVNGTGKTTTIGKLAWHLRQELGRKVVLGAADTFRAAAVEQLEEWSRRADVGFVRGEAGLGPGVGRLRGRAPGPRAGRRRRDRRHGRAPAHAGRAHGGAREGPARHRQAARGRPARDAADRRRDDGAERPAPGAALQPRRCPWTASS